MMCVPKYCPSCGSRRLRACGITEDDRWMIECHDCERLWAIEDMTESMVVPALELELEGYE